MNDEILLEVSYRKKLYSTKIGFQSFFIEFLLIMEYLLGDICNKVLSQKDKILKSNFQFL